jgi:hypothetical protein
MKQIPIISNLWNALTVPSIPARSLAVSESQLVLLTLRQRKGEFEPRQSATLSLSPGLVSASFDKPNINDEGSFLDLLNRLAEQANLRPNKVGNLNLALPAGSARSLVVALDSVPASKSELNELLEWKIGRAIGYDVNDLQISARRLGDHLGGAHWLVAVVHRAVLSQYESLLRRPGWKPGLILPRCLSEATWLIRSGFDDDQILVSLNPRGFEVVIVRQGEPIFVREVECLPTGAAQDQAAVLEELENEFHRLMIYYCDRLVMPGQAPRLSRVLTIGTISEQERFRVTLSDALGRSVISLNTGQLGLRLDPGMTFPQVAAAAGLAALAW